MGLIKFVLRRAYTVAAMMILICVLGIGAALRMPTDIFPEINIPVVSVVWAYSGMSANEIQNRIIAIHERQLASLVDDIERIEANSYDGVGVIKVYLHEGADVSRAISQLGASALNALKYMPRNIVPPLILRYGATDVPIIQLSLSSTNLSDTRLNDLGQNVIRPDLAVVRGASVPYPYGGKPRVIMVDLDQMALAARGLSPAEVSQAVQRQNVILPSGDVKLGDSDYAVAMNNSPDVIQNINNFPIREINGKMVFVRDVAHVHDGYQIQTNSVTVDGLPGSLMMIRKTGGNSTLAVVDGIRQILPELRKLVPAGVTVKPIFDQSIFVKAALNGVLLGGSIAAGLTGIMILLFLGNWRLTVIILISIPLSIITAVLGMYCFGETLNTMTLGGFSLATGILVDDATVVIENIERHVAMGARLEAAIVNGTGEILLPTFLSTVSICIVFIPVFLLRGTAHYLFSPLSMSVVLSLLASLVLSRTLVPVMFMYLMRSSVEKHAHVEWQHKVKEHASSGGPRRSWLRNPFAAIHYGFEKGFNGFRNLYRNILAWAVAWPAATTIFFVALMVVSLLLYPSLGMDFFPQVDAGQMRLHVRAPPGTRLEKTQEDFTKVEAAIGDIVGKNQVDVVLDNIGLPYSGINIALSDASTVGPMDGEILVSLKENHTSTARHVADLRRELPRRFPEMSFFFQPADIVNQVLNFGQAAPIDIRVSGPSSDQAYALAGKIAKDLKNIPGIVDSHVFQVPDAPSVKIDVDRTFAQHMQLTQESTANSLLVALNSSAQTAPNFWLDPRNGVSYPLVVQTPTYRIQSTEDLRTLPLMTPGERSAQLLMNIAHFSRGTVPMIMSQVNIRPVFDVNADVQGSDLKSAADAINNVLDKDRPGASSPMTVTLAGQVQTMQDSFSGLFSGMGLAVVLVFLLMVMNFQSWLDPLIVLLAVPFALSGVCWMLYLSHTHLSVPALMGTLMCIGLTTANSILVVTFANQRMVAGDDARTAAVAAGYTRLRPVLMTAGAMILGMIPMSLGIGEGGEQNAPLGRAVIGGLLFATFATLIFVPAMYRLMRGGRATRATREDSSLANS
jgi:multidrug efflux pump subunit AcrB